MQGEVQNKPEIRVKIAYAVLITVGIIFLGVLIFYTAVSVWTNSAFKDFESETRPMLADVMKHIERADAEALEPHLNGAMRTQVAPDGLFRLFTAVENKFGEFVLADEPQLVRFNAWFRKGAEAVYLVRAQYERATLYITILLVRREDRPIRVGGINFQEPVEGTPKKAAT